MSATAHLAHAVDLPRRHFPLGFPLSATARDELDLHALLADAGDLVPALTQLRARLEASEPTSHGELVALSLLHQVLRHRIERYWRSEQPGTLEAGVARAARTLDVIEGCARFVELFPPKEELALMESVAEVVLLRLANENQAAADYRRLFDERQLLAETESEELVTVLERWFEDQPPTADGTKLFAALRAPMLAADTLEGQLRYVFDHWKDVLPEELRERLLRAGDVLREETTMRGPGPGPVEVPRWCVDLRARSLPESDVISVEEDEQERFTVDRDWMSNVVLMAKNAYVWLEQLSREHGRAIERLDQIPDAALDRLASWGFTSLWLIGVWERSSASSEIKRRMGNPEALPSAYALYDTHIAGDLGGDVALEDLRRRAADRGIRLCGDMVPNHVGLYSRWVIEHPEWFVQRSEPPYPNYQFNGPDLCPEPNVGLFLEDGYWNHSDAAVVFKRIDHRSGETRYLYHGNDGTQMPWNDTAQLDFLNPDVREAVIQTILHVASHFPVIRFDAAMTLARRHVRRLWHPLPGEGGAIPSRSEHGADKATFDRLMPREFWREAVERVAAERPDTLLLAEAFWHMEGYFVRSLGMHRVYNSAFMNMLKMEENAKYRQIVRNVLSYSPQVLERFVNFMNNPDERTAVEQFGDGDKYIGVATIMVTMPGLPMIGHGQVEGFSEKYGMEFRRAYQEEEVNLDLVNRHEREIFPLMRRRRLFSRAENFAFFDFVREDGSVDENVFAYSNRHGDERALLVYNNAYDRTGGRLHTSTPINVGSVEEPALVQRTLLEALALDDDSLYALTDARSGRSYLLSGKRIAKEGIEVSLDGYQCAAFLNLRQLSDAIWWRLAERLNGSGVDDLDDARRRLELEPVADAIREVMRLVLEPELALDDEETSADADDSALTEALERCGALDRFEEIARARRLIRSTSAPVDLTSWRIHLASLLSSAEDLDVVELLFDDDLSCRLTKLVFERGTPDLASLLVEPEVRELIGTNLHGGKHWFRAEAMESLLDSLALAACTHDDAWTEAWNQREAQRQAVAASGYELDVLLKELNTRQQPILSTLDGQ